MPDEIEMQKRSNYFDLGRDDWMSMDEYLQSGLSNKDLGRAEGGIVSLPGFNGGGSATREGLLNRIKEVKNLKTITKELGTGTQTIGASEIKKPIITKTTVEGIAEGATRPSTAVEVKTAKRDYGKEKTFEVKKKTKIAETVTKARAPVFTGSSADYFKKLETYAGKNPSVLTSSGFLANFGEFRKSISDAALAGDKKILKKFFVLDPKGKGSLKLPNGKVYKFNQKVLNAAFENAFPNYKKVGQEAPLIRNIKKYFKKQGGKITKQGGVMLQMAVNEAQRLARTGDFKAARKLLSGVVKHIPNMARFSAWLGPVMSAGYITDILGLTDIMGFKDKKIQPSEKIMPQTQRFNEGGVMDIDYMTRPLGYAMGSHFEELVGDREREAGTVKGIPMEIFNSLTREEKSRILGIELEEQRTEKEKTIKGVPESIFNSLTREEQESILGIESGNVTLEEIMQDSEGPGEPGIIDRIIGDISPVDPIFKAKEKMKSVGKSLIDKVNDFMKYGWGDKEDYMEIGGEQVDPDDPNFRRFIEENYMGEGESYIEGIENYKREVEGEGYRRGGIVSLNHMTRAL